MKKAWMAPKKNMPIRIGAVPSWNESQNINLAIKKAIATKRLRIESKKPLIAISRRGILE